MKNVLINYALVFAIIAGLIIVSNMEYEDQKLMQKQYCDNVKDGIWPDDGLHGCEK